MSLKANNTEVIGADGKIHWGRLKSVPGLVQDGQIRTQEPPYQYNCEGSGTSITYRTTGMEYMPGNKYRLRQIKVKSTSNCNCNCGNF